MAVPDPPSPCVPRSGESTRRPTWNNRDPGGAQDILEEDTQPLIPDPTSHGNPAEQDVPFLPTLAVWGRACF
eukprot:3240049-Prorocentrum_lima.AAC.1